MCVRPARSPPTSGAAQYCQSVPQTPVPNATAGPVERDASGRCHNCSQAPSEFDRFGPACGTILPGGEEE